VLRIHEVNTERQASWNERRGHEGPDASGRPPVINLRQR
jgi:hypothetical protein